MKRIVSILVLVLLTISSIVAQNNEIKNVILLIPDGASLSAVSVSRWYQRYNNPEMTNLNIDPYICGTILTHSSNAPIADSAPAASSYMTGYLGRPGSISMYPPDDPSNDIVFMDPEKAYQPLLTISEAARITQSKATGLVFTCEFPNATPASCASHTYDRSKYDWIASQMVHNKLDVVIGGGVSYLSDHGRQFLQDEGYGVFLDDINAFRNYKGDRMWALFGETYMEFELDRDVEKEPSIAEMTKVAIEKLTKNENGFFLMVEGSKIDWAAHSNFVPSIITEMLAFDEACGVALDFAKADGKTVVVIVPDHGNSGLSIGSDKCPNYFEITKDELFGAISNFKATALKMVYKLRETEPADLKEVFYQLTSIEMTDNDYDRLLQCTDYRLGPLSDEERSKDSFLLYEIVEIIDRTTCFGFTTTGHTGEEVFLAVYDPTPNRLTGHNTNIELNHYLRRTLGLTKCLESLTNDYFAKHTEVFDNYSYKITDKNGIPVLEVKNKNNILEILPNTNIIKLNGKEIKLESVIVYVDKNNTFYLPRSLRNLLI